MIYSQWGKCINSPNFRSLFQLHVLEKATQKIGNNPVGIYLLKVNNRNTRTRCEICSKLMMKTPERCQLPITIKPHNHIYVPALVIYRSAVPIIQFKNTNIIFSNTQEVFIADYCSGPLNYRAKMKQSCHNYPTFQVMPSRICILHYLLYN